MLVHKHELKRSILRKEKSKFYVFFYSDLFEWEWEWCHLSCLMGSINSDELFAEAGNTYRKIPKISPSKYKPFQI